MIFGISKLTIFFKLFTIFSITNLLFIYTGAYMAIVMQEQAAAQAFALAAASGKKKK